MLRDVNAFEKVVDKARRSVSARKQRRLQESLKVIACRRSSKIDGVGETKCREENEMKRATFALPSSMRTAASRRTVAFRAKSPVLLCVKVSWRFGTSEEATVLRAGKQCIIVDASSKIAEISETLCIGCGICVKKCPYDAIQIINLPKNLESQTTHRYSANSFKLHRLPMPRSGEVLGLVCAAFTCYEDAFLCAGRHQWYWQVNSTKDIVGQIETEPR